MVVAMNLRKFASEKVTVSVDGKRFSWIHHDLILKKLNEKDLKTIYLVRCLITIYLVRCLIKNS